MLPVSPAGGYASEPRTVSVVTQRFGWLLCVSRWATFYVLGQKECAW